MRIYTLYLQYILSSFEVYFEKYIDCVWLRKDIKSKYASINIKEYSMHK